MANMQTEVTNTQLLAGYILERPLDEWVAEQRVAGLSWEKISTALFVATSGRLTVTSVTLRRWYADADRDRAAS